LGPFSDCQQTVRLQRSSIILQERLEPYRSLVYCLSLAAGFAV
jgi:hypothetical protein